VGRRDRRLDPFRARGRRAERPPDDGELALGADLVYVAAGANEDAQPVILRLVLDDGGQLEPVEALGADGRLDPDPG
jgi:hypothetical protein